MSYFNLKFIEFFENFARKHYSANNFDLFNLSDSITSYMNNFFSHLNTHINIKNNKNLKELKTILKISFIFLEGLTEDDDIELAFESFFQLEKRIEEENLCKKIINV